MNEPVFHSHISDCLPEQDKRAFTSLYCVACSEMVHAFNNETMQAWFDTGIGPLCLYCMTDSYDERDDLEVLAI